MLQRTPARDRGKTAYSAGSHTLFRDIETRATIDLEDVGANRYAADPTTEVRCLAYAVDDGPVQLWLPGNAPPAEFFEAADNLDWDMVAHGAAFEIAIENNILAPRYGFPLVPLERQRCTQATALAHALPAKLETLALALGLEHQKDAAGARVMLQMSKPRKARKGEDPSAVHWFDDPERLELLYRYCQQDVEVTREVYYHLPALQPAEQELWELDQRINQRGIYIDRALATAALKIAQAARPELDAKLAKLTAGSVTTIGQVQRQKDFLRQHGCSVESLNKQNVEQLLDGKLPVPVKEMLSLRQEGAKAAIAKIDKVLAGLDTDDRIRGVFRFHGASTGRWSSTRVQVHNLKRDTPEDLEKTIEVIRIGDYKKVRAQIPQPLTVISEIVRPLIRARPGYVLLGCDFSAVESRTLAWVAYEKRKLKIYRDFDRTQDPELEPYRVVARWLSHANPDRQRGKTADLAFGYGGSIGAWRKFEPDRRHPLPADQVLEIRDRWRAAHPNIERFWYALKDAAIAAVFRPGQVARCGRVGFKMIDDFLYLRLPSGRMLSYPFARIKIDAERRKHVAFMDNARGQWLEDTAWYGQLAENVTQAVARDLLTDAMRRVEAAGFPVILHVHDELVCEVPEGTADTAEFTRLMTILPPWADGLPIAAKAWTGPRYLK